MNKYDEIADPRISEEDWREAEALAARIHAGEEVMIPLELARRVLVDEEPPLRVFREWRGLTLSQLAAQTGLPEPELAELDATPTLPQDAAEAIAPALGIPPDLLHD